VIKEMTMTKGNENAAGNLSGEGESQDVCGIFCSDAAKVGRLKGDIRQARGLGRLFKALADDTRATILYCLSREELCVCDVAQVMGMSVQAVSHHLRLLKAANIVRYRRDGKIVY